MVVDVLPRRRFKQDCRILCSRRTRASEETRMVNEPYSMPRELNGDLTVRPVSRTLRLLSKV
jgi:hypothetical protein